MIFFFFGDLEIELCICSGLTNSLFWAQHFLRLASKIRLFVLLPFLLSFDYYQPVLFTAVVFALSVASTSDSPSLWYHDLPAGWTNAEKLSNVEAKRSEWNDGVPCLLFTLNCTAICEFGLSFYIIKFSLELQQRHRMVLVIPPPTELHHTSFREMLF